MALSVSSLMAAVTSSQRHRDDQGSRVLANPATNPPDFSDSVM